MAQRQPRLLNPGYLRWLRARPCDACDKSAPANGSNDAAHLKAGNVALGKPWAGSAKPDDKWATTLCRSCHMRQHAFGDELGYWAAHGIEPFGLATRLYAQYRAENPNANPSYVRKLRSIKPRKPRDQRQKIPSRPFRNSLRSD